MATDASGLSGEAQQLFEAALRLPGPQRAKLADFLLDSVGPNLDPDWEKVWGEEISRRIAEIESGAVQLHTWPEVRQRMQDALNAARKS